ncbi:hypothetical protein [Pseudoalteromonas sp. P1-25]|uniref:hypothetical protein n=1 Tax=Pseudoalteromonas sp. P1-25 TaxID=1723758 RepID=UPI0006D68635|nr:hypothetical protein [Pseudoalteromonas sp. P1-25]KPZ52428.1 hypothetical protein AN393_03361 [Pseudoalteromonas sp. P1-25]
MDSQELNKDPYIKLFWVTVIVSIFAFFTLSTVAISSVKTYEICFSYQCLNFFFSEVMLVPLTSLAAALPICAIFLTLHKSQQTKIQIVQSSNQNKTANFFMHRKEFAELCKKIEEKYPVTINWQEIYNKIFFNNINNDKVNLSYDSSLSDYFSLDENCLKLFDSLSEMNGEVDTGGAIGLLHELDRIDSTSGIKLQLSGSVKRFFLKDEMADIGIKHYMPLKLVNGSITQTWELYFNIMKELAFFSGTTFDYEKPINSLGRYNYVLYQKGRIVENEGD